MKNTPEETNEELDPQTAATLASLEGGAHEQPAANADNPLFRPGSDNTSE